MDKRLKEDIQLVKEFDKELKNDADLWAFYHIGQTTFSVERNTLEPIYDEYISNIFYYKNTIIIHIYEIKEDGRKKVKTFYHTKNSLEYSFFDFPELFSAISNYLDEIIKKPETISKITKLKIFNF